jgi:outer membrane lipoprotein carrier protein
MESMVAILLALSLFRPVGEEDLPALVDRVESHYQSVRDFEADFTQRYERRLLNRVVEEKGHVSVKKPGRMRWEYRTPEEKLFVTDGAKTYFYIPVEKQVMVSHEPRGAMAMEKGSPFELLAGKSRLGDSFGFFRSDEPPVQGGVVIHLVPLARHEEFEDIELEVDPANGRLLRLVLRDLQKNRTEFLFQNVRENVGLAETLFRFTIPSGVEVVVQSP